MVQIKPRLKETFRRAPRATLAPMARTAAGLALLLVFSMSPALAADPVFRAKDHAYRAVTVTDGLNRPWGMVFLPDGGLLITEKSGRVRHYKNGTLSDAIDGGPRSVVWGQGGLLDVAIHPDFAANRWVYFTYAGRGEGGASTELARARFTGRAFEGLEVLFKAEPKTQGRVHFGSRIVFDRDGYLYVTYGDRGGRENSQDLRVHQGSVFRFTDDGRVPPDNPFVGRADARPETYSYGHRNVQGAALHPQTGAVWTHEHGPQGGDEVNVIRRGANYGWPAITYGEEYGGGAISPHTTLPGMEQPVLHWTPSIAPSGMAFYTGDRFPKWWGSLFVGALAHRHLRRIGLDGERVTDQEILLAGLAERIRDVENGPDGFIYVLIDSADGRLIRLEPADGPGR